MQTVSRCIYELTSRSTPTGQVVGVAGGWYRKDNIHEANDRHTDLGAPELKEVH